MTRTIRVRLNLTVEVEPESWGVTYGTSTDNEVREDVRAYVANMLPDLPVPLVVVAR